MAELAGKDVAIKVSGTAVAMVGEATTMSGGDTVYQITDTAKRVLDRTQGIYVGVKGTNDTAEAGTTTTNLKMTAHGLNVNDVIINTTRSSAKRLVLTRVDADNVTVSSVTGQTSGDTIEVYKQPTDPWNYTVTKLAGKVTFSTATARTVLISGYYLPMSTAAYARSYTRTKEAELLDSTVFGATYRARIAGLRSASGTLSDIDITDTVFTDALVNGLPVVIEDVETGSTEPNRVYAMLNSVEMQAAVDGLTDTIVTWTSTDALIRLGV